MKKTALLFSILILNLIFNVQSNLTPIPEPEVYTRDEPYEVIIENLCPSAPPDDAVECQHSVLLAQGVGHILGEGTGTQTHEDKTLDFITCYSTKIPTFNFNLKMYCFFKGQKLEYERKFEDIRTEADFNKVETALLQKREEMKDAPTFYKYFSDLLMIAELAKANLLNGVGTLEVGQSGVISDTTTKSSEFNLAREVPVALP